MLSLDARPNTGVRLRAYMRNEPRQSQRPEHRPGGAIWTIEKKEQYPKLLH